MNELTLAKWAAGFNSDGKFVTGTLSVRETAKKYILTNPNIEEYEALAWAVGFATHFFKDKLHDTEREAIQACLLEYDAKACVAKTDYDKAIKKFADVRAAMQACDASQ